LTVRTALHGASAIEHDHLVHRLQALEPVRDQYGRTALGGGQQVGGEGVGRGQVEVLGGLVQHQYGKVGEQRPCQREALAFAAGQAGAQLTDEGVEPFGKRVRPGVEAGGGEGAPQFAVGGVLACE
jgi:hypothetical protein